VAIVVNVQPLAGALVGVWWLHEPLTVFTVGGGLAILTGLHLTVKAGGRE
jgi:drug/metabolite transporter (DMT)-like permease